MESSGARQALKHALANFSLENTDDRMLFERITDALTLQQHIDTMRAADENYDDVPSCEFTYNELDEMRLNLNKYWTNAQIEAAELGALLRAIDCKLSRFVQFVEENFVGTDALARQVFASHCDRMGVTPNHHLFPVKEE